MGRYVVLEQLGAGAMGRVVRAYDPELARDVAIKLVRGGSHAIASARLVREAQTLARLSHENVVAVYDVGTEGDDVFVAMELIEGRDLARWIAEAPRAWPEVLEVIARAAAGLQAAHEAGIVHRDLKPSNILVSGDPTARRSHGRVAVGDFGLARPQQLPDSPAPPADPWGALADDTLTATGTTVGTPAYMAPEQHALGHADARADQYALAVTLFECLWGRRPFQGADVDALLAHKRAGVAAAPGGAVPRRLWPAIARALAPEPAQRFASVEEFLAALRAAAERPARRRRAAIALAGLAAVGVSLAQPWARAGAPCEGLGAPLAAVWNDERGAALDTALRRAGGARGHELAAVVHALLDDHAQRWLEVRDEVCRATWIEQRRSTAALDDAMACLDRELSRMQATVGVLTAADADAALRAPEIVASLHSPRECLQPADGTAAGEPGLRAVLAAIEARLAAGDVATAQAELAAIAARVTEGGDADLALGLAVLHARAQELRGAMAPAAATLREAAVAARAHASAAALADVWVALARNAERSHRADLGRMWAALAAAGIAAQDDARQAELALVRGSLAFAVGDDDEAAAHYDRALRLRARLHGDEHPAVAAVMARAAGVDFRRGRIEDAAAQLERALAIQRRAFGEHGVATVSAMGNLGLVYAAQQRFDDAIAIMRQADAILEAAWGPVHPSRANAADSIGDVLLRSGRPEPARDEFARAIAIGEQVFGPEHPALASPRLGLGQSLLALGQVEQARAVLERALAQLDADAVTPVQLADTELALARTLLTVDRARAAQLAASARARYDTVLSPADDRFLALQSFEAQLRSPRAGAAPTPRPGL